MATSSTHFDREDIEVALVQRLISAQFPQWADLPITPAVPQGWDNRTFRLGAKMSVRLPSAAPYAAQVEKEHRWLPELAPHLPLDRKSTRLNSSHANISYAVFCLKK